MQPQGHAWVVANLIDFNMNPQEAMDALRWQLIKDKEMQLEPDVPNHIVHYVVELKKELMDILPFGRKIILFIRRKDYGIVRKSK